MSRSRHFLKGLGASYLSLVLNALYTLGSVPVALHYLSNDEFAVWAVVTQLSAYLMIVDLGTTSAGVRLLVDHKDTPGDGQYGSLIQTAMLTQGVQALLIWVLGLLALPILAPLLKVPAVFHHEFRMLWIWQVALLSVAFIGRISLQLLTAHHRMDMVSYAQSASLIVTFLGLWISFQQGHGLYSFAIGQTAGVIVGQTVTVAAAFSLKLFPPSGTWGRPSLRTAWAVFRFGGDLFLLSIGLVLISSSQTAVISRQLGLEAAAIWAIATKIFVLAQQFVARILDNSAISLSEMMVRGERERLHKRLKDVYVLTASIGLWVVATAAVCNAPLLLVWTQGRVSWPGWNDVLVALVIASNTITRVHINFAGLTKHLRGLQFIYLLEGAVFVALGLWAAKSYGLAGVLTCALVTNICGSGVFGSKRTAAELSCGAFTVGARWLAKSFGAGLMLLVLALSTVWFTKQLDPWAKLIVSGSIMTGAGGLLVWNFGLTEDLRMELRSRMANLTRRLQART